MTFDGVYDYEMPAEEHYHQNNGASVASTLRGIHTGKQRRGIIV